MKSRYDAESDILYLLIKEGQIKDTVEVSEDMFIEYDENDELVGIAAIPVIAKTVCR